MSLRLYMDHQVPLAITQGLRLRGIDVLTALEDGTREMDDSLLLDRAGELGRIFFTRDKDLLKEAAQRQREGKFFMGIIYAHQLRVSIGTCIDNLEIIMKASSPKELANQVIHLPL